MKLAVASLVLYVLFLVKDILILVLFGIIISVLFDPVIDRLQRAHIPRPLAAVGVYLAIFGLMALALYATAPFFVNEVQRFVGSFPEYFEVLSPTLRGLGVAAFADSQALVDTLLGDVQRMSTNILSALAVVFGGIFSTLFVITIAVFLSVEERSMERSIGLLFPKKYEAFALDLWARSQQKVSGWFLSRVISSLFVGAATYLSLALFEVQYPLSLGVLSFFTNFIPIVGPLVMGLLIAMIVALDSFLKAIFVVLAFVLIQQIEGNILTPLLSKRFMGVPPVLVLISLAVGGELWGVMGAILAIPLFGILFEFLRDFLKKRKEEAPVVL